MENLERVLDWVNEEGDLEAMITRISIPFGLGHLQALTEEIESLFEIQGSDLLDFLIENLQSINHIDSNNINPYVIRDLVQNYCMEQIQNLLLKSSKMPVIKVQDRQTVEAPTEDDQASTIERIVNNQQTWLTPLIKKHNKKLQELFEKYGHEDDEMYVDVRDLVNIFKEFLLLAKISLSNTAMVSFNELITQYYAPYQDSQGNQHYERVPPTEFIFIIEEWAKSHSSLLQDPQYIERTLINYRKIAKRLSEEDKEKIDVLIKQLEVQLLELQRPKTASHTEKNAQICFNNIKVIFKAFSGQDKNLAEWNQQDAQLNLDYNKFEQFLTHFGILDNISFSKTQAIGIFKSTANNGKLMSFQQFVQSLDKLCNIYYPGHASIQQKRDMLYGQIGLNNTNELLNRVTQLDIKQQKTEFSDLKPPTVRPSSLPQKRSISYAQRHQKKGQVSRRQTAQQFNNSDSLKDLIVEGDDQIIQKYFPDKEQARLQGIMKLHDEKLARSNRFLQKNSYKK